MTTMIRAEAEYMSALEKLDQEQETFQRQGEQLEEMDLSEEEVERVLELLISFHDKLGEEIETYERMRRDNLSVLHNLNSIGRWLIGARIGGSTGPDGSREEEAFNKGRLRNQPFMRRNWLIETPFPQSKHGLKGHSSLPAI